MSAISSAALAKSPPQYRGVKRGVLLGGEGVQFASQILQPAVHLPGLAPGGPLEEGVLGEVGQTVLGRQFSRGCPH